MKIPELNGIIKFISNIYNPDDIRVFTYNVTDDHEETVIELKYNHISDEYINSPELKNNNKLKEMKLELEIRKDVESYFGVKTSGTNIEMNGFSHRYTYNGLTIDVILVDSY
jgi:hypothetical protein